MRWKIPIDVVAFALLLSLCLLPPAGAGQDGSAGEKQEGGIKLASAASTQWQPSPEELAEFQAMAEAVQGFQEQVEQYRQEIQHIIATRYEERKAAVVSSYNRAIDDLEKEEAGLRLRAIEIFERFLARFPESPRYTPSALWRLAELHYEKSKLDYSAAEERFQQQLAAFNRGEFKVEPQPPRQHFERTIELLQQLVRKFPDFELSDGAYYLLAYSLQEQGEAEQAQQTYQAFLKRFPQSRLVPEVYTRLGESYFDDPNRLEQALAAYQSVLKFPDSRMYDKALYKLAWTYYKLDRFEEAVDNFDKLIAWADAGMKEGEEGEVDRGELRGEALQYLAISFAEEAWSGSGVANAGAFFAARGGRKYDGEFFRKLGETYFTLGAYENAVSAWRESIRRYPLYRENPKLMAAIVDAYYRLRQSDQAAQVQEEMVAAFGAKSEWRKANSQDPEAIALADKLTENAMYTAAVRHHTLAQRMKEQNKPQEAQEEYRRAAKVYAEYLQTFPGSRDNYKLTFYLAECYYYSLDFEKAAEAYIKVRDSAESSEFLADASSAVVLAYENMVRRAESDGKLEPLKLYTSKDRPEQLPLQPREIPALRQQQIQAYRAFAEKLPQHQHAGDMLFKAGQIYYAYDHCEPAREIFSGIVATSRRDDLVTSSINLIIESHLMTKDWGQVELWSRKLAALSRDPQQKSMLRQFELGARFNKATGLMQQGREHLDKSQGAEARKSLDAAADEFIRLVDEDPKHASADKALNNAAICYTWSDRPRAAGKIYQRIVAEYPKSEFADQALFLMSGSAEASYDFDQAVENYLKLVENYPNSKFRADAMFNAALALEGDRQYKKAAQVYERYATLFPDRPDAAENFFHAGKVLEKARAYREEIDLYQRFIKRYQREPAQRERIVMALGRICHAQSELKDTEKTRKACQEVVKSFAAYKLAAGGPAAEEAAQAAFRLAEMALKGFERITFDVPQAKLKKTLVDKAEALKRMENMYKEVFPCKRVQWTLAAYYRLGYLYQNFADVLTGAPCPRDLNQEECDLYKSKLEELAEAPIKKAVAAYQVTMEKSRELKLVNEWTDLAYESLNRYEPLQYPLQKKPIESLVVDRHAPLPLLQAAQVGEKAEGK